MSPGMTHFENRIDNRLLDKIFLPPIEQRPIVCFVFTGFVGSLV